MKVVVTGSSGFVGSALVPALRNRGHEVLRLVRRRSEQDRDTAMWNPDEHSIDEKALDGTEGILHLAGENVASGRWTAAQRERLLLSRTNGTALVARAAAALPKKPRVMVSASAIGYYGSRGEQWLDESSPAGSDFLANVCVQWEAAARPAAEAGIRVVHPRIGVVINHEGGALGKMLPIFKLGLGGPIADGSNYISWISRTDIVRALIHCLEDDSLHGPINLAGPAPVQNAEFTRTLARAIHRPAFFRVPKCMLKLVFGEMAEQTILSSMRVRSDKLIHSGFRFTHLTLGDALRAELSS